MGLFRDLFGQKSISAKHVKVELLKQDRTRQRKHQEFRKLENKKNGLIEQIKQARKIGNHLEVDYLWEELQHLKVDTTHLKRELKILNLEGIALKRYCRGLERLEKTNNKEGIRKLLTRIRSSDLENKLARQNINEKEYLDELNLMLEEVGLDVDLTETEEDDPMKNKFLQEIDAINSAEEEGEYDLAFEKENHLKSTLENLEEDEESF